MVLHVRLTTLIVLSWSPSKKIRQYIHIPYYLEVPEGNNGIGQSLRSQTSKVLPPLPTDLPLGTDPTN